VHARAAQAIVTTIGTVGSEGERSQSSASSPLHVGRGTRPKPAWPSRMRWCGSQWRGVVRVGVPTGRIRHLPSEGGCFGRRRGAATPGHRPARGDLTDGGGGVVADPY
jgi:hypothetical protein